MCGQYWLYKLPKNLRGEIEPNWDWHIPDYPELDKPVAVRPTNLAPIVRHGGAKPVVENLKWGIKRRFGEKEKLLINARSESVLNKPTWKHAAASQRCLVLASGWYEWAPVPGKKKKQKYALFPEDHRPLFFGGLWFGGKDDNPDEYVILTVAAGESLAPEAAALHNRAPMVVAAENYTTWLDPGSRNPESLIAPLRLDDVIAEEAA